MHVKYGSISAAGLGNAIAGGRNQNFNPHVVMS